MGIYLSWLYKEYKDGKRNFILYIKKVRVAGIAMFLGGIALMLFVVFYPRTIQQNHEAWSNNFALAWNAWNRFFFISSLAMILIPCMVGYF